uniref:Uncharacterized protein n=1 Tax=Populus trichocarpa TaxID=3694 RepID=A0A2K1ZAG4_POPTR
MVEFNYRPFHAFLLHCNHDGNLLCCSYNYVGWEIENYNSNCTACYYPCNFFHVAAISPASGDFCIHIWTRNLQQKHETLVLINERLTISFVLSDRAFGHLCDYFHSCATTIIFYFQVFG